MVLHWRRCGRVGGRQIWKREIVHKIKLVFTSDQSFKHCLRFWWLINFSQKWIDVKLERVTHHHVPWKLHIRNRNDKIFKYLNQDIRGNCYKQSNNYCLKKTDLNKIDLKPTPITLYRCSFSFIPVNESKLVMLERAYGGCLGTKSRWKTW